jgi:hypothetical protein
MYKTNTTTRRQSARQVLLFSMPTLAFGAALVQIPSAHAGQLIGEFCMEDLFAPDAPEEDEILNCTANDVKIASATNVSQTSCFEGETFPLTATFQVELSGGGSKQVRYDLGLYFDHTGDFEGDGARDGVCTLNTIQPGEFDYFSLDGGGDVCGDINSAESPLFPVVQLPEVLCIDTDGDGKLNLPNCTSWRQPGANELCLGPEDAFPGTTSKCNCDDNFNVPVDVETASAALVKVASSAVVTYTVTLSNTSATRSVKIDNICDSVYGPLAGTGCMPNTNPTPLLTNTCAALLNQTIAPNTTLPACSFSIRINAPGSLTPVVDTVTAKLEDTQNGNIVTPAPSDSASAVVYLE